MRTISKVLIGLGVGLGAYGVYRVVATAGPSVHEQLGPCASVIHGVGATDDRGIGVWVVRDGEWIQYNEPFGIDHVGSIRPGETVWLFAESDCSWMYEGKEYEVVGGEWAELTW